MQHCWKSHVRAQINFQLHSYLSYFLPVKNSCSDREAWTCRLISILCCSHDMNRFSHASFTVNISFSRHESCTGRRLSLASSIFCLIYKQFHYKLSDPSQSSTTISVSFPTRDGLMANDRHGLRAALLNSWLAN